MDQILEEWRPVKGLEGLYEVSSHGRVRSVYRWVKQPHPKKGIMRRRYGGSILKPCGSPYAHVHLGKHRRGVRIHQLVAEHFLPPCPGEYGKGKWNIDHRDKDTKNNRADNLRWLPHRENQYVLGSIEHGPDGRFVSTHR